MGMTEQNHPVFDDGRTKQSFKDSTDINKILQKAQKSGTLSHLQKYQAEYGDFSDMPDLLTAQARMSRGQQIFDELPSEIRREFGQSASAFFTFVNDPANKDKLRDVLPDLARPGTQKPAVVRTAATEATPAGDPPAPVVEPPGEPPATP